MVSSQSRMRETSRFWAAASARTIVSDEANSTNDDTDV